MTLINKMIGTGANSIYLMAVRSHGGDGGSDENPWIGSNKDNPVDQDILNQWETWFTAMDNNGITIFFVFYDDSSGPFGRDVGSQLDSREANLIDTIVSEFKHHKHLIWCVAEEYSEALSNAHVSKIAQRIKQQDDNNHPVAVHQHSGTSFDFNGNPNLDQFAVQYNTDSTSALHNAAVAAWNNVGGLKNVNLAEFQPQPTGSNLRQKVWAIGMGGAYSMILFMDIAGTPVSDLQICGRLVNFMQAARFNETRPYDSLARGNTDYVLADPGDVYIAYGDAGSSLGINIQAGDYRVRWYDPVDGDWVDQGTQTLAGGDRTFTKPGGISSEAVVLLESPEAPQLPAKAADPSPTNGATGVSTSPLLSWTAGEDATSHDVYFGTTNPPPFQGNQTQTTFNPGSLNPGTTHYWRIDEVNENGTTTGDLWVFETAGPPPKATNPSPADQAAGVSVTVNLSWAAASGATSYNVYFGTTSPPAFQGNQTETTFDPGTMEPLTVYFWRIDPVNDSGTTTGDLWSFTTASVPGDFDHDGDVDDDDRDHILECYTGPLIPGDPYCAE